MKAARYTAYGSPETIVFDDLPLPEPKTGEVLVRVKAAPVTAGDARMRSGHVPHGMGLLLRAVIGWHRPRVAPGWAFSGIVEGLGAGVAGFKAGQRVFGLCGFRGGAHREFLTIRADGPILPLPEGLGFEEGAAFYFGGLTAAEFLIDRAKLQAGERLLVNGATGAVGSAALQIARHLGARTTAVASAANHPLARKLGADTVQDYRDGPPSGTYDVVMDVIGTLPWQRARPLLAPGGRLLLITASLAATLGAALRPRRDGCKVIAGTNKDDQAAMRRLVALHEAQGYRPVLGKVLPFGDLARAHAVAESFHKPGNLVVVMGHA